MFCAGQAQQQLEAQQAQHAVELQNLSGKAEEIKSRLQQVTDRDQQHVTQLTACEADLDELRQVGSATVQSLQQSHDYDTINRHSVFLGCVCVGGGCTGWWEAMSRLTAHLHCVQGQPP